MTRPHLLAVLLVAGCSLGPAAHAAADRCAALAGLRIDHGLVSEALRVSEPLVIKWDGYPDERIEVPVHCRVRGVLRPGARSDVRFEVWLPERDWNGRFEMSGNGGYAGQLPLWSLAGSLRRGSVAAASDTGHRGTFTDPLTQEWAKNPDAVLDFGYRSIPVTAAAARRITRAYYGRSARYAYFESCSNGGRMALMAAQRYPALFDGILAGAPAANWLRLMNMAGQSQQRFEREPAARPTAAALATVQVAQLAACDATDGVQDGLVSQPAQCAFAPATLTCGAGAAADGCLSEAQADSFRLLFGETLAGRRYPTAFAPGTASAGWLGWIIGGPEPAAHADFALRFYRDFVHRDPNWTLRDLDPERDLALSRQRIGAIFDALAPDLRPFFRHGGKLILYHGWLDPAIPARDSIDYYEDVARTVGARTRDRASRLYLVPGMGHCSGGPGFVNFGVDEWNYTPPGTPASDLRSALRAWVEHGQAPAAIVAARAAQEGRPAGTRPLCPYPQVAHWDGHGDPNDAGSFSCRTSP